MVTLKKLLQIAILPVGRTMYVWGGGWNEADTGAGEPAKTLGISPRWEEFFQKQGKDYDYEKTRYQILDGLDCSGYIGWCMYNLLETKNQKSGYVMPAGRMAYEFARRGFGIFRRKEEVCDYRAGDLMSSEDHVYLVVGVCADQSVLLLHASPPGVQFCGITREESSEKSAAEKLAEEAMRLFYPAYYEKYPICRRGKTYLTKYAQMRWHLSSDLGIQECVMSDPDGYAKMSAEEILKDLYHA